MNSVELTKPRAASDTRKLSGAIRASIALVPNYVGGANRHGLITGDIFGHFPFQTIAAAVRSQHSFQTMSFRGILPRPQRVSFPHACWHCRLQLEPGTVHKQSARDCRNRKRWQRSTLPAHSYWRPRLLRPSCSAIQQLNQIPI